MACLCLFVNAQKSKPNHRLGECNFTGVGIFKIDVDTSVMDTFANANQIGVKYMVDPEGYAELVTKIKTTVEYPLVSYEFVRNDNTISQCNLSNCDNTTEYYISQYDIDGVRFLNVHLTFYKNKLVEFQSDDSDIITNAMEVKYGQPNIKVERTTSQCLYKLTGITRDLENATYYMQWHNSGIDVLNVLNKTHNDNCEVAFWGFFMYETKAPGFDSDKRAEVKEKPLFDKAKLSDF